MTRKLNKSGYRSSSLSYYQLTHDGEPIDAYSVSLPVLVEDLCDGMITSHVFLTYDQAEENFALAKDLGVNLRLCNIHMYVSELTMPNFYKIIRDDVLCSDND